MALAYLDAAAGLIDLNQRRTLTLDDYRRGTGLFQTLTPGINPTLRDLVTQMIATSDNIGTDIAVGLVGRERLNARLAQAGFVQTRMNMTTADLFRTIFVLADPKYATFTNRELFLLKTPDVPTDTLRRINELMAREPVYWLGQTTAREMTQMLLQILLAANGGWATAKEMVDTLNGQFYDSRLPRFIKDRALVGHKTGDFPPFIVNDVGIIEHDRGHTVVSVFVNENQGTTLQAEEIIGRIAEDLVTAWNEDGD